MAFTSSISIPDNSIFAGIRSTPSSWCRIPSPVSIGLSRIIFSMCVVSVTGRLSCSAHPKDVVKSPYGSASTKSTRFSSFASPTPRLTVVVVFPVPPFWFAMAITLHLDDILCECITDSSFPEKFNSHSFVGNGYVRKFRHKKPIDSRDENQSVVCRYLFHYFFY